MDILLVYATNSGGTAAAATMIAEVLVRNGRSVAVKEAKNAEPRDLSEASSIIIGSPSWDYNDMEGQPLPEMVDLINRCKDVSLNGKQCAVFGLGDSSYTYFCGAVTYLEAFIKRCKGTLVLPTLKIDGFYQRPDAAKHITKWAGELPL